MVSVPVYTWHRGYKEKIQVPVEVLDVHEVLSYLHTELGLCTPHEKVNEYWTHCKMHGQPHATSYPEGREDLIPFGIYGDETSLGDPSDKITCIFLILTLWKPKVVKRGHFLLCTLKDMELIHDGLESMIPILRHITWSSNVSYNGKFPSCNAEGLPLPESKQARAGQPLGDGRGYACVELRGDWLWHQRILRLRDIPVARRMCYLCDAVATDESPLKYYDDSEDAPWRSTHVDAMQFINRKVRPGPLRHSFELLHIRHVHIT